MAQNSDYIGSHAAASRSGALFDECVQRADGAGDCASGSWSGASGDVVSGPVEVSYPTVCRVVPVVSTEEMLATCQQLFPQCDGLIGIAAPSDYRPVQVEEQKIKKTGEPLVLHLVETPDIVATLASGKRPDQWVVGFALETEDQRFRAITKMQKKSCDLMVLNGPEAIGSAENTVEVLDRTGRGDCDDCRREGAGGLGVVWLD